jgi:hypothetical protein
VAAVREAIGRAAVTGMAVAGIETVVLVINHGGASLSFEWRVSGFEWPTQPQLKTQNPKLKTFFPETICIFVPSFCKSLLLSQLDEANINTKCF